MQTSWNGFTPGNWTQEIDVRDFIQRNYTPYEGDDSFLEGPSPATEQLWRQVMDLSEAYWTWIHKSFPLLPPTDRDIWTKKKKPL